MTDLARNLKRRTAAKGWLTRAVISLQILIADPDGTDEFTLSDAVQEFDKRLSTLDYVQSEIECDLPNEELDADIEAAANFRDSVRVCRMAAGILLRDMSAANKPPQSADGDASSVCGSVSNSSHDSKKVEARLPKLELQNFLAMLKNGLPPGTNPKLLFMTLTFRKLLNSLICAVCCWVRRRIQ